MPAETPGVGPLLHRSARRALRRAHRERMIERARRCTMYQDMSPELREHFARKTRDHLAACSCRMCGNPRKYHGESTRQELRADLSSKLDVETGR